MAAPTTAAEYVVFRRPALSGNAYIADLVTFCESKLEEDFDGTK